MNQTTSRAWRLALIGTFLSLWNIYCLWKLLCCQGSDLLSLSYSTSWLFAQGVSLHSRPLQRGSLFKETVLIKGITFFCKDTFPHHKTIPMRRSCIWEEHFPGNRHRFSYRGVTIHYIILCLICQLSIFIYSLKGFFFLYMHPISIILWIIYPYCWNQYCY